MAAAARVGVDAAGGVILGSGAPSVLVNGSPFSVIGDSVTPHPPPDTPHSASPVMVGSSGSVFAEGSAVCRAGDSASCGHAVAGGSPDTNAG